MEREPVFFRTEFQKITLWEAMELGGPRREPPVTSRSKSLT